MIGDTECGRRLDNLIQLKRQIRIILPYSKHLGINLDTKCLQSIYFTLNFCFRVIIPIAGITIEHRFQFVDLCINLATSRFVIPLMMVQLRLTVGNYILNFASVCINQSVNRTVERLDSAVIPSTELTDTSCAII